MKVPDNKINITEADVIYIGEKNIKFIRKDALLEWATNLKERWKEPPVSVHSPGCVYMLEQVIDKINSM